MKQLIAKPKIKRGTERKTNRIKENFTATTHKKSKFYLHWPVSLKIVLGIILKHWLKGQNHPSIDSTGLSVTVSHITCPSQIPQLKKPDNIVFKAYQILPIRKVKKTKTKQKTTTKAQTKKQNHKPKTNMMQNQKNHTTRSLLVAGQGIIMALTCSMGFR